MKKFFTLIAVAAMAFAAQANVLTVAEGTETNSHYPIYGLYYDTDGTISQMIYPDFMLNDLVGSEITELKFYARNPFALISGNLQLSMKVVSQSEFSTANAVEMTAEDVYGHGAPLQGETELVFTLDRPFVYEGGNLLIETNVIAHGNYATTYFYGVTTGLRGALYGYYNNIGVWNTYTESFLPQVTFTYEAGTTPVEPTEMTAAPTFNGYTTDGIHAYFVEIIPTEPSTIYYRIIFPDGTQTEWTEYEDILSFTENGMFRVEAYAVAPGKLESYPIAYEFVVSPMTGLTEMVGNKAVASQRFFNAAGQEMSEANGLTIVVTTYTDGTTSTVKVVK